MARPNVNRADIAGNIVRTRPPRQEDAEAVAALVTAETATWIGWPQTTSSDVTVWWQARGLDRERDFIVGAVEDVIVGYAWIRAADPSRSTLWLELWVPRQWVAIVAPTLLAKLERRAAELVRGSARLRIQVEDDRVALRDLLESRGFAAVRTAILFARDLEDEPLLPKWPSGVAVRTFAPTDARAVHALGMETLAETWWFTQEPFETWSSALDEEGFDPTLWFLAEADGELVGIMLCRIDAQDTAVGWLNVLAVHKPWRARGVAVALTRHALCELHRRGVRRVGASTDGTKRTKATVLGAREGFVVAQRFRTYESSVKPLRVRRTIRRAIGSLSRPTS